MRPFSLALLLILLFPFIHISARGAHAGNTNNIMLTGYWPPTNAMIRQFNTNPDQNPDGWVGENWEGLGYDVHSFFPEFPGGVNANPKGEGDFEVDYQDTSEDWWRITAEVNPVAIITFSRGDSENSWEVELRQRNLLRWINDFQVPFRPTPTPPDDSVGNGFIRRSSLPMLDIVDGVNANGDIDVEAFIDNQGFGGGFVSEFIAYHGVWYQDLHSDPNEDFFAAAAGHIHVGSRVSVADGRVAAEISLRELIQHVDAIVPEPSSHVLLGLALTALVFLVRQRAY